MRIELEGTQSFSPKIRVLSPMLDDFLTDVSDMELRIATPIAKLRESSRIRSVFVNFTNMADA